MQSNDGSYGGIISSSKKIKKATNPKKSQHKKPCSSSSLSDSDEKKYQTFDVSVRTQILSELKEGLIQLSGQVLSRENLGIDDVLNLIKKLKLPDYNKLIIEVFSKYDENLDFSAKALIQWRKKIVNWFKSSEKPETRGGVVVGGNLSEAFVPKIHTILDNMQIRCFSTLRNYILPMLTDLKVELEDGKPMDENTCSKHWWFNFLKRNEEIKAKWQRIPLERTYKKMLSQGLLSQRAHTESTDLSEKQISSLTSPNLDKLTLRQDIKHFRNYEEELSHQEYDEIFFDEGPTEGNPPQAQIQTGSEFSREVNEQTHNLLEEFHPDPDNFISYEEKQINYQAHYGNIFGEIFNQQQLPRVHAQIETELELRNANKQFNLSFQGNTSTYTENEFEIPDSPFYLSPLSRKYADNLKSCGQERIFNFDFN